MPTLYVKQKGHLLASSNACQLVLKYMLLNRDLFVKAWHNRVYSFSSGTKFGQAASELKLWFDERKEKWDRLLNEDISDVDVSTHAHTHAHTCIHTHTLTHTRGRYP